MAVLTVWNADDVIVFKRSIASGYAGVQNPLFRENSAVLSVVAKDRVKTSFMRSEMPTQSTLVGAFAARL